MKGERRRGRVLWRAVADDPYRKLMAIGLAVLMWFMVNNRIQATHTRRLPLVVVGAVFDSNIDQLAVVTGNEQVTSRSFWSGNKEIQYVDVTVSGPRFQIDSIRKQEINLEVRKPQSGAGGEPTDVESFEFTAADFRPNSLLRELEITMDPPRVRLEFKVEDSYGVDLPPGPGVLEIAVDPSLESRVLRQTASYYPKTIRIVGRGADLEKLRNRPAPVLRANLVPSGVSGNKVSARIQLVSDDLQLHLDPAETTIEMDLMPQTEKFTMQVPFLIDELSLPADQRGRFELEEALRSVPVNASGSLRIELSGLDGARALDAFGRDCFRLLVPFVAPTGATPDVLTLPAYLIPTGKLLTGRAIDRNEYSLAETVTVNLRRKQ